MSGLASRYRHLVIANGINLSCILLTLSVAYVAGFGIFEDVFVKGLAVLIAAVITFLDYYLAITRSDSGSGFKRALHSGFIFLLLFLTVYALIHWMQISWEQEEVFTSLTNFDNALAYVGIAGLLVLTYRQFGLMLTIACILTLLYIVFADSMPGIFRGPSFDWERGADRIWFNFDGVFGRPMAVVTRTVLVFIVFGAILERCGAGNTLLRFASSATGGIIGGPAHSAIVSSALFGTLSGAAVANVVSTGVFTIPVIQKSGFKAKFAGAVEAAASSGGQIMPPVMGVVAFYMADVTGIPYLKIIAAAALPALFYYFSLFLMVRFEAGRLGIKTIPKENRVKLTRTDWWQSLVFVGPILALGWQLVAGRSPAFAGFTALVTAFILALILYPKFRSIPEITKAIIYAGRSCALIIIIAAAIGIIIAIVSMSGFGVRFAAMLVDLSGTSLFLSLVIVMIGCLVLGMGLPTGAAYLLIVLAIGPALQKLGLPMMSAHLFVIYYAVLSAVTPPVALAAFAAAPICGANPMAVGFEALKLSIAGFIIPFVFAYHPDILFLEGFSVWKVLQTVALFSVSTWLIATALIGFEWRSLNVVERVMRAVVAGAVLFPISYIYMPGLLIAALLIGTRIFKITVNKPSLERK